MTTIDGNRIYRLTEAGARARGAPTGVPAHYRRILRVIDGDTHVDVIRGWLRQFSNARLGEWIGELVANGMLSAADDSVEHDLDFTTQFPALKPHETELTDTELMRIDAATIEADTALKAHGAYLSEERLKNRPKLDKRLPDVNVLVVEDDPDQAALAERRLGLAGYQVSVASTHEAFVAALQLRGAPDVVFLDVELPDGDGFDILVYIRKHPRLSLLPVIMLTAKTEAEDIRRGLRLGADGYIPKPYSKSLLSNALREVLGHR